MGLVVLPHIMRDATKNIEIYRCRSRFSPGEMPQILNWIGKLYDRHDILIRFCVNSDVGDDFVRIYAGRQYAQQQQRANDWHPAIVFSKIHLFFSRSSRQLSRLFRSRLNKQRCTSLSNYPPQLVYDEPVLPKGLWQLDDEQSLAVLEPLWFFFCA